jgi:hypothetical protein
MARKKHPSSGHAKMRPRARLISLIGDELISDECVAIVELVKNAYDADATRVMVRFEGDDSASPERLAIEDNGHGMDLETVLAAWFEPGTVIKKQAEWSPSGRLYQGAKGVGRFAAARLGKELLLETSKRDSDSCVTVLLEWGRFDDDSYLDDIEITYDTSPSEGVEPGTVLTIENLASRKTWTEEDYKNLHYRLSRLVSPFEEITNFSIDLVIPAFPELTGEVEPHSLTTDPKYRLEGSLSTDGVFEGVLLVDGKIKQKYRGHSMGEKGKKVGCGAFSFELRAWDRDRTGLSPYMLKYDMSITQIRQLLNNYCGVSIYRDGFRVHPYGEQGNDWLTLDNRSRQTPARCLANNQIIASIQISRNSSPDLVDRTPREGLVHNLAYEDLKEWFVRCLMLLEEERYRLRPREDATPEYTTTIFEAFDMTEVVQETDRQLGKQHPITKLVKEKDGEIRDGVKRLQEHYSRILLAAGVGQLVDIVIHEIGAPLQRINREVSYLDRELRKILDSNRHEWLAQSLTSVKGWLEQIGNLRARLDPKTAARRGRASSFAVQDEIAGNLLLFENLIEKQNVKVTVRQPEKPLVVHMSRSSLGQVIANLLDNSIYWLTRHHGDGKGGQIHIEIKPLEHGFCLMVSDDGPGIAEEDRELAFDQYFSRKPNGMGLGLYIARQIIEPYGRLLYTDEGDLSGAAFEAFFERNVGI